MKRKIAIIGTGLVGLQLTELFAKTGMQLIAYDNNKDRILELQKGMDGEHPIHQLTKSNVQFTAEISKLIEANCYIAVLPTPLNPYFIPDLSALKNVARVLGQVLKPQDLVIFESTVFPGATEELLIPLMEEESRLKAGKDFFVGYSPERVVTGDPEHRIESDVKVISAQSLEVLEMVKEIYQNLGLKLFSASSIKVAEASKLLESVQRDVNIALMNEYTQILDKMNISMHDVLETAKTKWNFLPFTPGLVGGENIPVDPYYLIYRANGFGINPNLISIARQINEQFIHFIANSLLRLLNKQKLPAHESKVVICGISFKANIGDIRHSLSLKLYKLLEQYGVKVFAFDNLANHQDISIHWVDWEKFPKCQAIIFIQPHEEFIKIGIQKFFNKLEKNTVIMDIPGMFAQEERQRKDIIYWNL